ncbi:MAG: DUF3788 family protein [Lentimicrobiaceae bacterium]|jgi:hypothetical protein
MPKSLTIFYSIKHCDRFEEWMKIREYEPIVNPKATGETLASEINNEIKITIASARVFAKGRGFRVEVRNKATIEDIKRLIDIKLKY